MKNWDIEKKRMTKPIHGHNKQAGTKRKTNNKIIKMILKIYNKMMIPGNKALQAAVTKSNNQIIKMILKINNKMTIN